MLVQKTSNGQGSPFMRGFTGFRNVLLVDGIRLNNSVFREGPNQYWNTVDVFAMSRVEVLKGPASVLYGSDAIGGAVNVLTDVPGTAARGPVLARPVPLWRMPSRRRRPAPKQRIVVTRCAAKAGYTYKDYGDVEAGGSTGEQRKTGYDEQNVDARLEYDIGERTTLALGYQYVDQDDAWRTHRTIYGISWKGTQVGTDRVLTFDQGRQLGYVQVRHDDLGALPTRCGPASRTTSRQKTSTGCAATCVTTKLGFDVGTTGLWVQFDKKWGPAQLVYGADYYSDDVSAYNVEYNANSTVRRTHVQGPVADDATYDLAGVFVQAIVDVSPRLAGDSRGSLHLRLGRRRSGRGSRHLCVVFDRGRLGQLLGERPPGIHSRRRRSRGCSTRAWRRRFVRRTCRISRASTRRVPANSRHRARASTRKRSCPGRRA